MTEPRILQTRQMRATLGKMEVALGVIDNAIVWTDQTGNIQWCNAAFDRLIGRPHIELLGTNITTAMPLQSADQSSPAHQHPASQVLTTQTPVSGPYLFLQDQQTRCLELTATPVQLGSEQQSAVLVIRDVTAQRALEQGLHRHELMLQSVVVNSPVIILAMDSQGVITLAEGKNLALLGLSQENAIGCSILNLYRDQPSISRHFQQALAGRNLHTTMKIADTCFEVWFSPIREETRKITGIIAVATDITEQQRLADQEKEIAALKRADELKMQFLSILSHELRTPLSVILGYTDILDKEIAGPLQANQHQYLKKIRHSIDLLTRQVHDLLDVSQIHAHKLALFPRPIDLSWVFRDMVADLSPLAEKKGQTLQCRIPPSLPLVMADEQRIGQVLSNLLDNAIKFTPDGGSIEVRARVEGDQLVGEIEDSGPGIPPEKIPLLFQYFTQLDMSPTRKKGGLGLGLTISKEIVQAHTGQIGVTSQPEHGCTFWFRLPLLQTA